MTQKFLLLNFFIITNYLKIMSFKYTFELRIALRNYSLKISNSNAFQCLITATHFPASHVRFQISELMKKLRNSTLESLGMSKLQDEIDSLRPHVYDLEAERQELSSKLKNLQGISSAKEHQMKKMQEEKIEIATQHNREISELQGIIDARAKEFDDLNKRIHEEKTEKEDLENKLKANEALLRRIQDSEDEIVKLKSEIVGLQDTVAELEGSLEISNKEKQNLSLELTESDRKSNEWQNKYAELNDEKETQIANLRKERDDITANLEDLKKVHENSSKKVLDLDEANARLQENLNNVKNEKETLTGIIDNLQREKEELSRSLREKEDILEDARKSLTTLREENKNLQRDLGNLEDEKKALSEEIHVLQKERDDERREKDAIILNLAERERNNEELSRQLRDSGEENNSLKHDLGRLRNEKESATERVINLQREKEDLSKNLQEKEQLLEGNKVSREKLIEENKNLQENLGNLENKNEALTGNIDVLRKEREHLSEENNRLQQNLGNLEGERKNLTEKMTGMDIKAMSERLAIVQEERAKILETLENERKERANAEESMNNEIRVLKEENTRLEKTLVEVQKDKQQLSTQLEESRKTAQDITSKFNELSDEKGQLLKAVEENKPLENIQGEIAPESEGKNEDIMTKLESLEREKLRVENENRLLTSQFAEMQTKLSNLESYDEKIRSELKECENENKKLLGDLRDVQVGKEKVDPTGLSFNPENLQGNYVEREKVVIGSENEKKNEAESLEFSREQDSTQQKKTSESVEKLDHKINDFGSQTAFSKKLGMQY